MNARERILDRVRAVTGNLPMKSPLPELDLADLATSRPLPEASGKDRVGRFCCELEATGARVLEGAEAVAELLRSYGARRGYVDPALVEQLGSALKGFELLEVLDRDRIDDYDFGITKADLGIAETGSFVLSDGGVPSRLAALAPWIHVALLEKDRIVDSVSSALEALDRSDPSQVIVTGPSKTADIEGVLIQGVHGPGIQVCLLVP